MQDITGQRALYEHFTTNLFREEWGGRGGRNAFHLWRAMIGSLQGSGKAKVVSGRIPLKASIRNLSAWTGIGSFDTLYNAIEHLAEMGVIEIVSRGAPDSHVPGEERKPGRPAIYAVRVSEHTPEGGTYVEEGTSTTSMGATSAGVFRLPNAHLIGTDLIRSEPQVLRLLDIMHVRGVTRLKINARIVADTLGMAISSCHEMLKRWRAWSAALWMEVETNHPDLVAPRNDRQRKMEDRNRRHESQREGALKGRWVSKKAQVLVFKMLRGFRVRDVEWSEEVHRMQLATPHESLDPGEMLRAWYNVHGGLAA